MKKVYKKIQKSEIVSFDIFDTLIQRMVPDPSDVFELMSNCFSKSIDLKKIRIQAEREARLSSHFEEITIEEIYDYFPTNFTAAEKLRLIKMERELELSICIPKKEIKQIYDYAVSKKKRIIFTSDMYLDRKTVESILNKCGYNKYETLYLSSELRKTKRSGSLFKHILIEKSIPPKKLFHIGDNIKSDYLRPSTIGINAKFLIKRNHSYSKGNLEGFILEKFLVENKKKNFFEQFGYEAIGPILFGFSTHLSKELEDNPDLNLFFLSRDGKIMKKALEIIAPEYLQRINYLYGSRRAIIVPSLSDCKNIEEILKKFKLRKYESIQSILKRFGIEKNNREFRDIKAQYLIDPMQKVDSTVFQNETVYRKIIESYLSEIKQNAFEEKEIYQMYLEKENFTGKIGLVDIGWYGNMQNAIENITRNFQNINIYGYYLGNMNNKKKSNSYGYLFDADKNPKIKENVQLIIGLFEFFFTTDHGSVIKMISKNDNIIPLLDKFEYEDNDNWGKIESIQKGALQFISEFHSLKIASIINLSVESLTTPLFKRIITPNLTDAEIFGEFSFFDNGDHYIAKHQKGKSFFKEFKNCSWRIGFMKRYLKLPLPYRFIEILIRKKFVKKDD